MKKIKVMLYADSFNVSSGYSKVGRELALRLAKMDEFEVYFQEIISNKPTYVYENVTILPSFGQRGTPMFLMSIVNNLRMFSPDIFIPICDTFLLERDGIDKISMPKVAFVPYIMIDSYNLADGAENILNLSKHILTGSQHGIDMLKEKNYNGTILTHGVDLNHYKPASKQLLNIYRKDLGYPEDKNIFLFIGRNFLRKRPMNLLEAIAIYNKNNPNNDSFFIFHCADHKAAGWDLELFRTRMSEKYKVNMSNVVFTAEHSLGKGMSESDLVKLYQISNYYITASSGEGFGLPIIEAMACGKIVIAPDNTTHTEFLKDGRGFLVKNDGCSYVGFGTYQPIVDNIELAKAIENVLKLSPQEKNDISTKARDYVIKNYDWDNVAKQLSKIIIENVEVENDKENSSRKE